MRSARVILVMMAVGLVGSVQAAVLSGGQGDLRYRLQVEIADTPQETQRGLMHRPFLPGDAGMLFDFRDRHQPVTMWMKNTYIPLDMVFLDEFGRILGIAKDTRPLSLAIISAPEGTQLVLEVNAGVANKYKMKIGDVLEHPLFADD